MARQWIRRHGTHPGHFTYRDASGRPISAARAAQIDALAIPPGWRDVHIAPSDRTSIQAWGYDSRGRKQYRYHPRALQKGQIRKYYRVRQLARDLPTIRRRVDADFRKRGLSRERVLAAVLRLISQGYFRVGNDRYTKENHTFGITTLRKSHVRVKGDTVTFMYIGKRSIRHKHIFINRDLAQFVNELLTTPGRHLFRYATDDGRWCDVTSRQVNEYLQAMTHFPYTAKDFRTWGGTLLAATVLSELGPPNSEREARKNVVTAVRIVAAELGNTPAICRQSYVHPIVLETYLKSGSTISTPPSSPRPVSWAAHLPEERALIHFLDAHFPERRKHPRVPQLGT